MKRKSIGSFQVSIGKYSCFLNDILGLAQKRISSVVCVANVHMLVEAYRNENFNKIINEAALVTPDGKPLTWILRMFYGIRQERVAGMDLLPDLLDEICKQNLSPYFYGGSPELLKRTEKYLKENYPTLEAAGFYSPPFKALTKQEEQVIVSNINSSGANIVFVVLGCPKQEKWMASVKGQVNAVMVGIGGALQVMVGVKKRAPRWMQNIGLEWFFRLLLEPKRLFFRYASTNTIFIFLMAKEYIKIKIFKNFFSNKIG